MPGDANFHFRGAGYDTFNRGHGRGPDNMLGTRNRSRGRYEDMRSDYSRQYSGKHSERSSDVRNGRRKNWKKKDPDEQDPNDQDKDMSSLFLEFSQRTSLQGVTHFSNPKNRTITRGLWIFFFLCAIGATVYQLYTVLDKYFQYETTNVIKIGYENLDFPSVTFCNLNALRWGSVEKLAEKNPEVQKLWDYLNTIGPSKAFSDEGSCRPPHKGREGGGGTTPDDGGRTMNDGGRTMNDGGRTPDDRGTPQDDGGTSPVDRGTTPNDQGTPQDDGGMTPDDRGTTPNDQGTPQDGGGMTPDDGGTTPNDQGTPQDGGGMTPDDGGTTPPGPPQNPSNRKKREADGGSEDNETDCTCSDDDVEACLDHEGFDGAGIGRGPPRPDSEGEYGDDEPPPPPDRYGGGSRSESHEVRTYVKELLANITRDTRKKLGHNPRNFILDCEFNGRKCSYKNVTRSLDGDYGNCFTFNSVVSRNESLKTVSSGVDYGLSLMLYLEAREHVQSIERGNGIRLVLHPFNTIPFLRNAGLSIPAGFTTYIGIKKKDVFRLGKPYNACNTSELFLKEYGRNYTKDGCLFMCPDRMIVEKCGCFRAIVDPNWLPKSLVNKMNRRHPCSNDSEVTLDGQVMTEKQCVRKVWAKTRLDLSRCNCLDACNETYYDILTSSSVWPGEETLYVLGDALCQVDRKSCEDFLDLHELPPDIIQSILRENFLYLKIYYRDLNFETNEQQAAYEQSQFLSDLGGTAGLYLGATVLTLVEILSFCTNCCTLPCRKKKTQTMQWKRDNNFMDLERRMHENMHIPRLGHDWYTHQWRP